jgi:flagellar FliJ protein
MSRSNRLQPVVQFAHRKEKHAAQEFGDAQHASLQEQKKLQDLQRYREEYIADFQRRGRAGVSGAAMQQFQHFLARLDEAISQQIKRVGGASIAARQKNEQWQEKLTRSRALNNAVTTMQQQEQRLRDRIEQKEADERNTRRYRK